MNFLNSMVGLSGESHVTGFGINDDKDGIGAILPDKFVNSNIILMQFWASVVPAYNLFPGYSK